MADQVSLTFIEIDVPHCSLTYGVAPCTASLTSSPPTGTIKCFNSLGTCQDREHFTDVPVTLRFAIDTLDLPTDIEAFPFIKSVDFTPATVSLEGDLGQRATLKVIFKDVPHSDAGDTFDKYPETRNYDPYSQGTFWGKFRARNPFLRGRAIRLIRGLVGQTLAEMEARHFLIDSLDGPTPKGEFTIIGNDVLKLADGDRAQAPELSNGFLVSAITAIATSATLSPAGIGNGEYPASGYATIGGNEVVTFTRSADVLTLTRGQMNTVAVTHDIGDRVQVMLRYVGQDGADILADLWDRAGADSDFIPLAEWQAETAAFLGRVYTLNIAVPTSINKLITEMLEVMGAAQWWDDVNEVIRLQILRAIATTAFRYNEDNVLAGTLEVSEQPEKRVSRVIVYFGQINPLKRIDELENYRSSELTVDDQSEIDEGSSSIKTIFARAVAAGGRTVASRMGELYLSRYVRAPRLLKLQLMRYSGSVPLLGSGYRLGGGAPFLPWWPFQDETGARVDLPIQVTQIDAAAELYKVQAQEMLFTPFGGDIDPGTRTIIFDADENNVNLRTRHDELFPAPESGNSVNAYINAGIIIGSSSTSLRALDIGTWPAGVSVTLIVAGRIEGAGGDGGAGGGTILAGHPGGTALYARFAFSLELIAGSEIWSGGGGGGGGNGGSGGGGGGKNPGSGGAATGDGVVSGNAGTTETGGSGGNRGAAFVNGGAGGAPGHAGVTTTLAAGGAAGVAVDGISYCSVTGSADIRGSQIN